VARAGAEEVAATLARAGIEIDVVRYEAFTFRHVDVMGSGRFFYASEPIPTEVRLTER